jgi:hypothetical protein
MKPEKTYDFIAPDSINDQFLYFRFLQNKFIKAEP